MNALVTLALLCATPAAPAPKAPAATAALPASWGTPRAWSDGVRARKAWADPVTLAELQPDAAFAEAVRRAIEPTATVAGERARVRLWTVSDAAAVRAKLSPSLSARALVVWRDAPSTHAAERIAAGGLVLRFAAGRDDLAVAAFLAAHGLTLTQRLAADLVLLECAPGDAGWALAERLGHEPGVSLAMPNWWRMGHPK